jgi:hypothetical protein
MNRRSTRFKTPNVRVMRKVVGQQKRSDVLHIPLQPRPKNQESFITMAGLAAYINDGNMNINVTEEEVTKRRETYADKKSKTVDEWRAIRPLLCKSRMHFESGHDMHDKLCVDCQTEKGCIRCYECGPAYWSCEKCCIKRHICSPLHNVEIQKVSTQK